MEMFGGLVGAGTGRLMPAKFPKQGGFAFVGGQTKMREPRASVRGKCMHIFGRSSCGTNRSVGGKEGLAGRTKERASQDTDVL